MTDETPTTVRPEFYEAFKRQAEIFDKELKEYNKELNVTLLFVSDPRPQNRMILKRIYPQAALFAIVASTFLKLEESRGLLLAWDSRQGTRQLRPCIGDGLTRTTYSCLHNHHNRILQPRGFTSRSRPSNIRQTVSQALYHHRFRRR